MSLFVNHTERYDGALPEMPALLLQKCCRLCSTLNHASATTHRNMRVVDLNMRIEIVAVIPFLIVDALFFLLIFLFLFSNLFSDLTFCVVVVEQLMLVMIPPR